MIHKMYCAIICSDLTHTPEAPRVHRCPVSAWITKAHESLVPKYLLTEIIIFVLWALKPGVPSTKRVDSIVDTSSSLS